MGEGVLTSTPYDDVFRTLLNDCSSLIIPVINEVFGEHYQGTEEIVFSPNEHFLNQQDGNEQGRVTDTSFKIIGHQVKKYHWECQSSTDASMLVRFFEYDTQIALDEGKVEGGVLTVTFPHSAVLYLRCSESTPDKLETKIVTPGGSVTYGIQVMKAPEYTVGEIFEKGLLFLIPFHIFSHERKFKEYERDGRGLESLKSEYGQIRASLEELLDKGAISEYMKCTVIDMSNKVLEHIAKNYVSVREGVRSAMGGRVLEYEAKTIKNEGREEGREEGIRGTVSVLKELGIPMQTIRAKIQEEYNLTPESCKKYL